MEKLIELLLERIIEITAWVFITIFIINITKHFFTKKIKSQSVILGSFLGATPGCAGAISAATLFIQRVSTTGFFASAMIATIGDGAFLVLASKPKEFLLLTAIMFVVAIIVGLFLNKVNWFNLTPVKDIAKPQHKQRYSPRHIFNKFNNSSWIFFYVIIPFLILDSLKHGFHAGQAVVEEVHNPILEIAVLALIAIMVIHVFVFHRLKTCAASCKAWNTSNSIVNVFKKTFGSVAHIVTWVLIFLVPITIASSYIPLDQITNYTNPFGLILLAALLCAIPGSGIHIFFATLYISGYIPFEVLLAASFVTMGEADYLLLKSDAKNFFKMLSVNLALGITVPSIFALLR